MPKKEHKKYEVLARKYRPGKLSELIGQDALVRTLTNSINEERIPHAFILTGIRGVGKTSTARILARSLICTGKDGKNIKPTTEPCGTCENCAAVAEDRHVDILEMDAASHTGVAEIREIIDNVNYSPVMARYKIYIIDEVHMLSKSAFNALLKTLEEPPSHTKFVFATTEVRKIPVTILSRCMRFDLSRVESRLLSGHMAKIADKEKARIDEDALKLISYVAEGSVRDALSLLDQAIGNMGEGKKIRKSDIQRMLGIADRKNIFDLFSSIVEGKPAEAIGKLKDIYQAGGEPVSILQDLLELSHFVTQLKVIPEMEDSPHIPEEDIEIGKKIANALSLPFLSRLWQILLKGIEEAKISQNTLIAAEMIVIRASYISDLPTPGDLVRNLTDKNKTEEKTVEVKKQPNFSEQETSPTINKINNPINFSKLVEIFSQKGENITYARLQEISLVNFDFGNRMVEFTPANTTPGDLAGKAAEMLSKWTGNRWVFVVSNENGEKSLRTKKEEHLEKEKKHSLNNKEVQTVLKSFSGSFVESIEKIDTVSGKNIKSGEN